MCMQNMSELICHLSISGSFLYAHCWHDEYEFVFIGKESEVSRYRKGFDEFLESSNKVELISSNKVLMSL